MKFWFPAVLCLVITVTAGQVYHIPTVAVDAPDTLECPPNAQLAAIRTNITANVSEVLQVIAANKTSSRGYSIPACGGGGWRGVALLNMADPNQTCPHQWRLYEPATSGTRACGRQESHTGSCDSVRFPTNGLSYTEVCGRITGYQFASPDGLYLSRHLHSIDRPYVDGVSVTRGAPRQHIWTLYAGVREFALGCCSSSSPADFVGSNYFCDTGNPQNGAWSDRLFTAHPLWDGEAGCPSNPSCCAPQSGPWFHSRLAVAEPVGDDIEVRICGGESTSNEDTPLELVEIFVRK